MDSSRIDDVLCGLSAFFPEGLLETHFFGLFRVLAQPALSVAGIAGAVSYCHQISVESRYR